MKAEQAFRLAKRALPILEEEIKTIELRIQAAANVGELKIVYRCHNDSNFKPLIKYLKEEGFKVTFTPYFMRSPGKLFITLEWDFSK